MTEPLDSCLTAVVLLQLRHKHKKNPFWQESSSASYIYRVRLVRATATLIPATEAAIHAAWSSLPFQPGDAVPRTSHELPN